MVAEQEANAKTCASLVLRLNAKPAEWKEAVGERSSVRDLRDLVKYPFARLLKGFEIGTDVVRSRVQYANDLPAANENLVNEIKVNQFDARHTRHRAGVFETVGAQDPCAPSRQSTKRRV
jgi:hypothetical protein